MKLDKEGEMDSDGKCCYASQGTKREEKWSRN
jgi:hypothetical protein